MGAVANAFLKIVPPVASASIAGVRAPLSPYAPTRSARSVSIVTIRKLRAPAGAAERSGSLPLHDAQSRRTAIRKVERLDRSGTDIDLPTDT